MNANATIQQRKQDQSKVHFLSFFTPSSSFFFFPLPLMPKWFLQHKILPYSLERVAERACETTNDRRSQIPSINKVVDRFERQPKEKQ
jgi:hypothetical protein